MPEYRRTFHGTEIPQTVGLDWRHRGRPGRALLFHADSRRLAGAVGLAALTGYLDYVLLPALLVFIGMLVYGLFGSRDGVSQQCCAGDAEIPAGADKAREAKHG